MQHSKIAAPLIIRTFLNISIFILALLHLVFLLFCIAITSRINQTSCSSLQKITLNNHIVEYNNIQY
ncbi:hypothetical protein SAMN05428952_102031 [Nitrosomonas sp. Nm132]|jgi:hypothetical protein|nr:hypothetical protein SAMN05428952_102031 [Nitrosomonas sp. Nm132]